MTSLSPSVLALGLLACAIAAACGSEAPAPAPTAAATEALEVAAPATKTYRLANALDLRRTARRWATLANAGPAADVYLAPFAGDDWALGIDTADEARAAALAARFEQEPLPWQVPEPRRVRARLVETAPGSTLHETPGGELVRRLPPGLLGVALRGTVGERESELAGAAAHVVYSDFDQGWLPPSRLSPYEGCLPSADALRPHVPVIRTGTHESRALVARVRGPAAGFLLVSRDPRNQRSFAGVFRDLGDCRLEGSWVAGVEGMAEYALSFADGSLAVGYVPAGGAGEELRWEVFRRGREAPLVRRDVPRSTPAEVTGPRAMRLGDETIELPAASD